MPIYEYRCDNCGHELETIQKLSEAPLTDCPSCNQPALRKRISAGGFRLKGSGWYETDFKSGNKKNVARGDDSGPSSGGTDGSKGGSKDGSKEKAPAAPAASGSDSKPAKSKDSGGSRSSAAAD